MSKVIVTGCAGMIGSNACRAILSSGRKVLGIDNFYRGLQKNVESLASDPGFEFMHYDLACDDGWNRAIDSEDTVIHIADVVAGIGYVFANEFSVFQKNNLINSRVASAVSRRPPGKVIYLGTACSYPQSAQLSVTESGLDEDMKFPADPESGYGWSKLIGDIELGLLAKMQLFQYVSLDLHNVYGWPCVYEGPSTQVMPALISRAFDEEILTVWGDGAQGRAFLHVDDVARAILAALSYDGEVSSFMVGPDKCTTIAELAKLIVENPSTRAREVAFDTSKPTGDIGRFSKSSRSRDLLGWTPTVTLEDGVASLIARIGSSRG